MYIWQEISELLSRGSGDVRALGIKIQTQTENPVIHRQPTTATCSAGGNASVSRHSQAAHHCHMQCRWKCFCIPSSTGSPPLPPVQEEMLLYPVIHRQPTTATSAGGNASVCVIRVCLYSSSCRNVIPYIL